MTGQMAGSLKSQTWEHNLMVISTRAKTRMASVAAVAAAALILAACGSSTSSTTTSAPAAASSSSTPASTSSAAAAGVTIGTASGKDGTYLTGASGRAVYLWVADSNGKSSCSGSCASVWPPVIGKPTAGSGVTSGDLGTITRSDGKTEVTYKGHPLYYYAGDPRSGTTTGQGSNSFGAKWWLLTPAGAAITKGASASGSSGGSSTSASSGSGGWG
jgi:predicted lipoprotein with Yx(FWY)xxD motif